QRYLYRLQASGRDGQSVQARLPLDHQWLPDPPLNSGISQKTLVQDPGSNPGDGCPGEPETAECCDSSHEHAEPNEVDQPVRSRRVPTQRCEVPVSLPD